MARLIDADKLKRHYAWWENGSEEDKLYKAVFDSIINLQPTVEAVEVVRCEHCVHYKQSEADPSRKMCWRKDVDGFPVCYDFCPTDFCSKGEPRND